jgi:hypothetical protein
LGWLSGWQYRKSHVVNAASGAGTNYQVKIIAHYGSGTDSGADVYLNSHCRTDFGDVRFTDDDGETLLDYWMESKVDSDYAIFWVEVADDLSSANATIYIYYGKSDASTTSNGANTFLFFDDFLSSEGWSKLYGNGSFSVSDGILILDSNASTGTDTFVGKSYSPPSNFKFITRFKPNSGTDSYMNTRFGVETNTAHPPNVSTEYWHKQTNKEQAHIETSAGVNLGTTALTLGTWYRWVYTFVSSTKTFKLWINDSYIGSGAPTGTVGTFTHVGFEIYKSNSSIDYLAIAKYVDPEPSHGSWGSEEQAGGVTYEIYVDAACQSLAISAHETTYNIAKDASVASQSLPASETTFNLLKEAIAKSLAELNIETKFNIEREAITQTLALAVIEVISGIIEIFKDATATAQVTFTLESTFNISQEATIKVLAEVSIIKPTEVRITRLFLILGDLAIQIQGG